LFLVELPSSTIVEGDGALHDEVVDLANLLGDNVIVGGAFGLRAMRTILVTSAWALPTSWTGSALSTFGSPLIGVVES
jgi:hypothetical protein